MRTCAATGCPRQLLRSDRREVAAGAVAADHERTLDCSPTQSRGRDRVLRGGREGVLGREPVVGADHGAPTRSQQRAAVASWVSRSPIDEAAAVEEDERRARVVLFGPVYPAAKRTGAAGDVDVLDGADLDFLRSARREQVQAAEPLATLRRVVGPTERGASSTCRSTSTSCGSTGTTGPSRLPERCRCRCLRRAPCRCRCRSPADRRPAARRPTGRATPSSSHV